MPSKKLKVSNPFKSLGFCIRSLTFKTNRPEKKSKLQSLILVFK